MRFRKRKTFLDRIGLKVAIRGGIAAGLSWFLGVWFSKALAHPDILASGTWCVCGQLLLYYRRIWEVHIKLHGSAS
ncbi:hypothetical protein PARA125_000600 [Parachlamydia sp. AcF125]|nr:hypothetical protein [Parachlamydia sp. AcF125]